MTRFYLLPVFGLLAVSLIGCKHKDKNCIQPAKAVGDTSWINCIKGGNTEYDLPAGTYYLDRQLQLPDNVKFRGAGPYQTKIMATKAVDNGCGTQAEVPGDPKTRIGFVLGNHNYIGEFTYIAKDTHRWQGYNGAPLCGGGVFETPGCADAYCKSPENIGDQSHGNGGVHNVQIQNVIIRGETATTGPQVAVFVTQTRDLKLPSHTIQINGIDMDFSFADGINLHGSVHDVIVSDCTLRHQGDDNLAVWSAGNSATNIVLKNNKLSQTETNNPSTTWGNCVALYGGGLIEVTDTVCTGTSNGGVKFAEPPMMFGGTWGQNTKVLVQDMVTDNGKPSCVGTEEVFSAQNSLVNQCPLKLASMGNGCPDPCWIHKGCTSGNTEYRDKTLAATGMGTGWYCKDTQAVNKDTAFDQCCIHPNCQGGVIYNGQMWVCKDGEQSSAQLEDAPVKLI